MVFFKSMLGCALAVLATSSAYADTSTAPTVGAPTSTAPSPWSSIKKNIRGTYIFETYGQTVQDLDGVDGPGKNFTINHYFSLGYKVGSKWTISAAQMLGQKIDDNELNDPLVVSDPYVTFSNSSILKNEKYGFNMNGFLRYYMPVSRATRQNANRASDEERGGGMIRFMLNPTKTWLDGALSFNLLSQIYYYVPSRNDGERLAANGTPERMDYFLLFDPTLGYDFNETYSAYVVFESVLAHRTNGQGFTKFNEPNWGHNVQLGSYLNYGSLTLNPVISMGPVYAGLKSAGLTFTAIYRFL